MSKQKLIDAVRKIANEHGGYLIAAPHLFPEEVEQLINEHWKDITAEQLELPKLDDELLWILGRPNFTCAGHANILRESGLEIPKHAEEEQANVIYFYLCLYLKYGKDWRKEAEKRIEAMAKELKGERKVEIE